MFASRSASGAASSTNTNASRTTTSTTTRETAAVSPGTKIEIAEENIASLTAAAQGSGVLTDEINDNAENLHYGKVLYERDKYRQDDNLRNSEMEKSRKNILLDERGNKNKTRRKFNGEIEHRELDNNLQASAKDNSDVHSISKEFNNFNVALNGRHRNYIDNPRWRGKSNLLRTAENISLERSYSEDDMFIDDSVVSREMAVQSIAATSGQNGLDISLPSPGIGPMQGSRAYANTQYNMEGAMLPTRYNPPLPPTGNTMKSNFENTLAIESLTPDRQQVSNDSKVAQQTSAQTQRNSILNVSVNSSFLNKENYDHASTEHNHFPVARDTLDMSARAKARTSTSQSTTNTLQNRPDVSQSKVHTMQDSPDAGQVPSDAGPNPVASKNLADASQNQVYTSQNAADSTLESEVSAWGFHLVNTLLHAAVTASYAAMLRSAAATK